MTSMVRFFDPGDPSQLRDAVDRLHMEAAAISPDGSRIAVGSGLHGMVFLRDVGADPNVWQHLRVPDDLADQSRESLELGPGRLPSARLNFLQFSPDSRRLLGFFEYGPFDDPKQFHLVWDTSSGVLISRLTPVPNAQGVISEAQFIPDGGRVIGLMKDPGTKSKVLGIVIWDSFTGEIVRNIPLSEPIQGGKLVMEPSPRDDHFYVIGLKKRPRIAPITSATSLSGPLPPFSHPGAILVESRRVSDGAVVRSFEVLPTPPHTEFSDEQLSVVRNSLRGNSVQLVVWTASGPESIWAPTLVTLDLQRGRVTASTGLPDTANLHLGAQRIDSLDRILTLNEVPGGTPNWGDFKFVLIDPASGKITEEDIDAIMGDEPWAFSEGERKWVHVNHQEGTIDIREIW